MSGALGVVLTTDVPVEGRAAVPAYVDESLPIVGPARAVQVVTSGPMAGGPPMAVRLAPAGTPALGPALPIYIVSGILDTQAYTNKVKALAPLAYWPLAELSGATAIDESGNGRNGVYSGVTLGAAGIGDGRTAAAFDGNVSYCNVYGAGLAAAFSGAEGTIAAWFQVANAGVWTDGATHYCAQLQADANNLLYIRKQTTNNQLAFVYAAGGTSKTVTVAAGGPTGWFHVALTWSKSADQMRAYINGTQASTTQIGLGTWAGALSSTKTVLGNSTTSATQAWSGPMSHAALWNSALNAVQITSLATVNTW